MTKWLNLENLYSWVDFEGFFLLSLFFFLTWSFYKVFLPGVSAERHRNIQTHFRSITKHYIATLFLFCVLELFFHPDWAGSAALKFKPYLAVAALVWGLVVFIRVSRLFSLMYLFLKSMNAGVPLLIVNIFTLLLSIALLFWFLSSILNIQLGPLLATSAAFSIVLGLALQDTLGNLIAGVAIQLDDSFHIGNWLEVVNGINKAVGQVREISWRSTTLIGFNDELIVIPNRIMASALISNYSPQQPILRSQLYRLPHSANVKEGMKILEQAAHSVKDVLQIPAPLAFVNDVTSSSTHIKLVYWIESYGSQFLIGDQIYRKVLESVIDNQIQIAPELLRVETSGKHI